MYKLGTAATSGAMLLSSVAPFAAADLTVTQTGNGAFSSNNTTVNQSSTTNVNQNNDANITNNVTSNANSGGNSAGFNTGGEVTIGTGAATTSTAVTNNVNSNVANVTPCGGCDGNTSLNISGNGAVSDNSISVDKNSMTNLNQQNNANVTNDVSSKANSGKNTADFNTGGDVTIGTGPAITSVDVRTNANRNVASIGSNGGRGGDLDVNVTGNGAFSDNGVDVDLDKNVNLNQNNNASIYNDVDVKANSGDNGAFANTGGDVVIGTGSARARAVVDNAVNFNWANLEACCVAGDVNVKIAGNGAGGFGFGNNSLFGGSADNSVNLDLSNDQNVGQNNDAALMNGVYANAKSGYNSVDFSVGFDGTDPSILTGAAEDVTVVSNTGNTNTFGSGSSSPFPMPTSTVSSNMNSLWMLWANWMSM